MKNYCKEYSIDFLEFCHQNKISESKDIEGIIIHNKHIPIKYEEYGKIVANGLRLYNISKVELNILINDMLKNKEENRKKSIMENLEKLLPYALNKIGSIGGIVLTINKVIKKDSEMIIKWKYNTYKYSTTIYKDSTIDSIIKTIDKKLINNKI